MAEYQDKPGDITLWMMGKDRQEEFKASGYLLDGNLDRVNTVVQKVTTKNGKTVRRLYAEVGAMFETDSTHEKAPWLSGKVAIASLPDMTKISLWKRESKDGRGFLSGMIDEPYEAQAGNKQKSMDDV